MNRDRILSFVRPHLPLLFFVIWALILSFEFWGFGADSYVRIFDSADGRLATRIALNINLFQGEVGYWNWDLLSGIDRLAEGNSLEWINVLFYTLPGWLAYGIFMFLQRLVAGFFSYQLLRKHLSVRPWVALFPAMFYALWSQARFNNSVEGFTVPNSFSLAGIPMILFLLGQIATKLEIERRKTILLAALLGFVFAGMSNFAFSIFLFPLIAIWLVVVNKQSLRNTLVLFSAFTIGWLALEGWELWAAWLQAPTAHRTLRESCVSLGAVGFSQIVTGQADTHNFPLLILGFAGLPFYRKGSVYRNLLVVLAMLAVYDMASDFLPRMLCSALNPFEFLTRFNTSRVIRYTPFFISLFAGLSAESILAWVENREEKRFRQFSNLLGAVLVAGFLFWIAMIAVEVREETSKLRTSGHNYRNIFENPYLEYVGDLARENPFTRAAVIFHKPNKLALHTAFFWPSGVNTIDGYTTIYPIQYSQFWGAAIDPMMTEHEGCRYGHSLRNGDNRVYLSTNCGIDDLDDELDLDKWFNLDLLSVPGVKYFISRYAIEAENLVEHDLSNIKCTEEILGCKKYHIYENPGAYPAISSRGNVTTVTTDEQMINRLRQSDADALNDSALMLNENATGFPRQDLAPGELTYEITKFGFDKISFTVTSGTPQIIVVNSGYSPFWRVSVNRIKQDPFPVYHILTGLFLPAGEHEVVMTYEPPYSLLTYYFKLERLLDR